MNIHIYVILIIISFSAHAQSLFVPDGFSNTGIGTSSIPGNIGIGEFNNSPTEKLDVTGNGKFCRLILGEWDTPMISFNSKTFPYKKYDFDPTGKVKKFAAQLYLDNSTGHLYFRNDLSGIGEEPVWQYPIVIFQSGNVSIGNNNVPIDGVKLHANGLTVIGDAPSDISNITCNPKNKLYVNGTIATSEVRISTKNWCDYVFDKDYQPKNISEIEKYIKENKHLPEVPSEKEIIENGMSVSDLLKIQMKKIEELTLYVIDLQKQNDTMRKELNTLKKNK